MVQIHLVETRSLGTTVTPNGEEPLFLVTLEVTGEFNFKTTISIAAASEARAEFEARRRFKRFAGELIEKAQALTDQ